MRIKLEIRWKEQDAGAREIEPVFFALLKAIRKRGALRPAAEEAGISYRHAWGLVRYWTARFSKPLVTLEKGRGARLTAIGEKLLWAEQLIATRLTTDLDDIAKELDREFSNLLEIKNKIPGLRINASHDLAIAYLHTLLSQSKQLDVDFHFRGSLESLRELANSRCDVAGFHFPAGDIGTALAPLYRQWLVPGKYRLLRVATRQQGLMTQKHNPRKITGLNSLTKRSVRFVNRQPESGTRNIFDELLKREDIDKTRIRGYRDEEFTHIAVAAMVASGAADAGFGIKAAAGKFGLNFIPVIDEIYVLAIDKTSPEKTVAELKRILKSRQFRTTANALPGYDVKGASGEMTIEQVFG